MTGSKRRAVYWTRDRTAHGHPYRLTSAGYELLADLARAALEKPTIAASLGFSTEALNGLLRRDEKAREIFERGRASLADELQHILLEQARKGNVVAAIYLTKARCGWRDNDPAPISQPNISITLPAAQSAEDYRRTIDVTPREPIEEESDGHG